MENVKKLSSSKKMIVWIILSAIAIIFSSYFIAVYFLSTNAFSIIYQALENINTLYKRSTCLSKAFVTYREEILSNTTQNKFTALTNVETCMELELEYTN